MTTAGARPNIDKGGFFAWMENYGRAILFIPIGLLMAVSLADVKPALYSTDAAGFAEGPVAPAEIVALREAGFASEVPVYEQVGPDVTSHAPIRTRGCR